MREGKGMIGQEPGDWPSCITSDWYYLDKKRKEVRNLHIKRSDELCQPNESFQGGFGNDTWCSLTLEFPIPVFESCSFRVHLHWWDDEYVQGRLSLDSGEQKHQFHGSLSYEKMTHWNDYIKCLFILDALPFCIYFVETNLKNWMSLNLYLQKLLYESKSNKAKAMKVITL